MLKMDNIRLVSKKKFIEVNSVCVFVAQGHVEGVELSRFREKEVLVWVSVNRAEGCSWMRSALGQHI
jgi:hypothetical protein